MVICSSEAGAVLYISEIWKYHSAKLYDDLDQKFFFLIEIAGFQDYFSEKPFDFVRHKTQGVLIVLWKMAKPYSHLVYLSLKKY